MAIVKFFALGPSIQNLMVCDVGVGYTCINTFQFPNQKKN